MNEKTVVITEQNGTYHLQNNGISEFELIGILECIVFDMKTTSHRRPATEQIQPPAQAKNITPEPNEKPNETIHQSKEKDKEERIEEPKETDPGTKKENDSAAKREVASSSSASTLDLRTRIGNAIKAIRGLGADIEDTDLSNLTDEELQSELEELTSQYKRLKVSKDTKK